ncbi:D-aminoacyl-tRNA deacylase [Azotobacter beijerinckii]|uniref:D-aminoacyl-tRNA deacylase n=1 Tax=Azotobacter beijerinckii TaxID=170623 RepID=UPI00295490F7|nr:D-aminoacyl-tRNA deacylase [Azotobacter beijerinckii]MDV7213772.1 D-aminoacyl-tRNA deacylase [Azotobacter beijerinckii]
MRVLIQRVATARVTVAGEELGAVGRGLLALVGIEPQDDAQSVERMLQRLLNYRVFADAEGRMNLSLAQVGGGLLLVSQFTLAADTRSGLRPSFSRAAPPAHGQALFEALLALARERHPQVAAGRFGAHMQVELVNDGPVTFLLET